MNRLTKREPLTVIHTFSNEKYFTRNTPKEFEHILETKKFIQLIMHGEKRIASSNVREFDHASAVDYFNQIILPTLPRNEKSRIEDAVNRAIENGVTLSLEGILGRLEELRREESS